MLYYQIALTNVPFDNSYKNVLRFSSRSEQETYFNVSSLFSNSTPKVNFNVGTLIATNIGFDCLPTDSINELLSKNYCIIKDLSPTKSLTYYYYFVTNAKQECENRISVSLELDVMQTYYLNLEFSDCFINRAHLNRFVEIPETTKVKFDGGINSKLFTREDIKNVSQRLVKRTKLNINNHNQTELDTWLDEHIYAWLYIYLDSTHSFKFRDFVSGSGSTEFNDTIPEIYYSTKSDTYSTSSVSSENNIHIPSNISCICVPIMKDTSYSLRVAHDSGSGTAVNINTLETFLKANGDYSYVIASKVSYLPPFDISNINYTISGGGNWLTISSNLSANNHFEYFNNIRVMRAPSDYALYNRILL